MLGDRYEEVQAAVNEQLGATGSSGSTTLTAGQKVRLSNAPLYSSATAASASGSVTGTYYLWDASARNGRVRITNKRERVGVSGQVTGWVETSAI